MPDIYRVTIQSENEGSRSFVYELRGQETAEFIANEVAQKFEDQGYTLVDFGLLELGDVVMELCTF